MTNLQTHISHLRRRNRNKGIIASLISLDQLAREFIGIDTPEILDDRKRDKSGHINMLENSPETYGRSLRETRQKYMGDVLACHTGKNDADCELDEQSAAIVNSTIHTGDMEKPL